MQKKDKIVILIVLLIVVGTIFGMYSTSVNNGSTYEMVEKLINGVLALLELLFSVYF